MSNENSLKAFRANLKRTFVERFWKRVRKDPRRGCWLWLGTALRNGHGQVWRNGKPECAHRVSWELAHLALPKCSHSKGVKVCKYCVCVLHKCDNPSCVNPDHLFVGSLRDNVRDMVSKGRKFITHGTLNGASKLTEAKVLKIRDLLAHSNRKGLQLELAKKYRVAPSVITKIKLRYSWNHV